MIKVEGKKISSKEEQLQKTGQLLNKKNNEPGESLVEERGVALQELPVTSKRVSLKADDPL